jgi:anti-sigma-K factor RskA
MATDSHLLTGAHGLDAIPPGAERDGFAEHLLSCNQCRFEARSLRETAGALGGLVAAEPPPGLHERVLRQIVRTPQDRVGRAWRRGRPARLDGRGAPWTSGRPRHRRPAAAAAALLLGVGLGTAGAVQLDRARQTRLAADSALRDVEVSRQEASAVVAVVADPDARRVAVDVSGGRATLVSAGSRAVLLAAGLPALPADRAYQVWVVHGQAVTSAGLGPKGRSGGLTWHRLVDGLAGGDSVALSVEPAGGSDQPTTTPIAVLTT